MKNQILLFQVLFSFSISIVIATLLGILFRTTVYYKIEKGERKEISAQEFNKLEPSGLFSFYKTLIDSTNISSKGIADYETFKIYIRPKYMQERLYNYLIQEEGVTENKIGTKESFSDFINVELNKIDDYNSFLEKKVKEYKFNLQFAILFGGLSLLAMSFIFFKNKKS